MSWIPGKSAEKYELMRVWRGKLSNQALRTRFHWDDAECGAVIAAIDAALAAYDDYETGKTTEKRILKDRLRAAAVKAMREFAAGNIRHNKRMGAEDRLPFGLRPKSGEAAAGGEMRTRPVGSARMLGGGLVEFRFQDEGASSRGIPPRYAACFLAYAHGPAKVNEIRLLDRNETMTRHIYLLRLPPEAVGDWLSFALCWQDRTGTKGAWTEIQHIPVA